MAEPTILTSTASVWMDTSSAGTSFPFPPRARDPLANQLLKKIHADMAVENLGFMNVNGGKRVVKV